ncbi:MAG: RHS repeat-associated core domain-containing protein [Planctomycetes bacterium]|nr:RHS repeat-associated core domain-containing protein [Planctomycetota bacterium]
MPGYLTVAPAGLSFLEGESTHLKVVPLEDDAAGDDDYPDADATTANSLAEIGYAFEPYANLLAWRYDVKMQSTHSVDWSQKYTNDDLGRLIKADQGEVGGTWPSSPTMASPDTTWEWHKPGGSGSDPKLDKLGNWVQATLPGTVGEVRTHPTFNQIGWRQTTTPNKTYAFFHDSAGNLRRNDYNHSNGASSLDDRLFTYDYRNRLLRVEFFNLGYTGHKLAEYRYDGLNRRVRRIGYDTDGSTELQDTRYIYDGWRSVAEVEYDDQEDLTARYVYGLAYLDEMIHMDRDADGDGDPYDDDSDGAAESWNVYFVQDHLYNVVALVYDDIGSDASAEDGTVVERTWYEPYGKVTFASQDGTAYGTQATQYGNEHLFTGQRLDATTRTPAQAGLYYYKNRYYDATLGRFITRDPLEDEDGLNYYAYADGSPPDFIDPVGELALSVDFNFLPTPAGFSAYGRVDVRTKSCPLEVTVSAYAAAQWSPPGMKPIKVAASWFNIHIEAGLRGGLRGEVKYSECSGLTGVKVCGRFEAFLKAEYRRHRYKEWGRRKRFTRFRIGAAAEGNVEVCINLCNGEVTLEGTISANAYLNFGWSWFNRSYQWEYVSATGVVRLGTCSKCAFLSEYCGKGANPDSPCCKSETTKVY